MIAPQAIASACFACGSRLSGANQRITGTMIESARPATTSDTGGRSSAAPVIGAAIVSVVKQTRLPKDVVESLFATGVERDQRQTDLLRRQQSQPMHHVFQRDRIGVHENRLGEIEELEMQPARFIPPAARRRVA